MNTEIMQTHLTNVYVRGRQRKRERFPLPKATTTDIWMHFLLVSSMHHI